MGSERPHAIKEAGLRMAMPAVPVLRSAPVHEASDGTSEYGCCNSRVRLAQKERR
jgi:hypothetical protein